MRDSLKEFLGILQIAAAITLLLALLIAFNTASIGLGERSREHALMITFRVWLVEIPVAALNSFVLMDRVYAPRVGELHAHQIALATRIGYVLVLAFVLVHFIREYVTSTLVYMGMLRTALWLTSEWGGSLLIGRPVHEILIGWHIERGTCGRMCCPPTCCHHSSSG